MTTQTNIGVQEIASLERELIELKKKLSDARRRYEPHAVKDYTFKDLGGQSRSLTDLFAGKQDLVLIHNMGKGCVYCTLWADGFTGFTNHLKDRAGFVLVTPDAPEVAAQFARERGWNFPVVSSHGTTFKHDMGFEPNPGKTMPGVQTFRKDDDGAIRCVGSASFGPGDDFCSVWHLFDLLEGGTGDWSPKYDYKQQDGSCGAGCGCH